MAIFELLKLMHDRLLVLAQSFVFAKRYSVDMHRMALYGSLLEFTGGICILITSGARAGVPSLFRSFLEAVVELKNLITDPDYVDNMSASHKEQWLKVLKEAKKGNNPYLALIATLPELDAQITSQETELQRLATNGRKPLNVFDRFECADMVEEYRSLYNFLSCDAHSNIRALMSRHIEIGGEDEFEVIYYKDEPIESFVSVVDSTGSLLLGMSLVLHDKYATGKSADVNSMLAEWQSARNSHVA